MSSSSNLFVSVIIPVFNDPKIRLCLEALQKQTYPQSLYEVIVIDNGSDEDIESIVSESAWVSFAREDRPGSYAARNKGISLAKGEIIAFTDADCIPEPDWIERGVASLLKLPNCGLVAGKINLFYKDPEQPTTVELYDRFMRGYRQDVAIDKFRYGLTANVFTFRSVLDKVGMFDSELKSNGDTEWGQRVYAFGYQQFYADDACVAHPARNSFHQLRNRMIRITGGQYNLMQKKKENQRGALDELIDSFLSFLPPRKDIIYILRNEDLPNHQFQKIKLIVLVTLIKYTVALERLRLRLGGEAFRG